MFPLMGGGGAAMAAIAMQSTKVRGVHLAIVVDNAEGDGNPGGRVKVKYPTLGGDASFYARIAVPMGGKERGTYVLPEVDDQVLVVFEHGDINRPIIIGATWSKQQQPVEHNESGKNNTKLIKSRAGHRVIFDDTEGAEKITIVDKTKQNKIVIDAANKLIKIESAKDIAVIAEQNVIFHANAIKIGVADGGLRGTGKQVLGHAGGTLGIKAQKIAVSGSSVTINAGGTPAARVSGQGAGFLGAPGGEKPKDPAAPANDAGAGAGAAPAPSRATQSAMAAVAAQQQTTKDPDTDAYVLSAELTAPGGEPLGFERVSIIDPETDAVVAEVITEGDGTFAIKVPAQKNYHLRIEGEPVEEREQLDDDEVESVLFVKLYTYAGPPYANKFVKVKGEGVALDTQTDEDGFLRVPLAAGRYELDVEGVVLRAHTVLVKELAEGAAYEFVAGSAYVIATEIKSPGGEPIGFEKVSIIDPDTKEPVGEPVVTAPDGTIRVVVPHDKDYDIVIHDDDDLPLPPPGDEREVTPTLQLGFVDADGEPVAFTEVKIHGPGGDYIEITEGDGTISQTVGEAGEYQLVIGRHTFVAHTLLQAELAHAGAYQFVVPVDPEEKL